MKAIVYKLNISKYLLTMGLGKIFPKKFFPTLSCISFRNIEVPKLPGNDWIMVKTLMSGICGSDMNAIFGKESVALEAYASFPAVMGHENIGIITEKGSNTAEFSIGDRVYVEPIISCDTRGIELCPACARGDYGVCRSFASSSTTLKAGCIIGFNSVTGGGWGEYFVAHKNHVFKIPNEVPDDSAVFVDAIASALQPVATHFPSAKETVLVYGAGILGICTILCLRALGFKGKILNIYRHNFQGELTKEKGANIVFKNNLFPKIAKETGAKLIKNSIGKPTLEGGVDQVFDCVGSSSSIDNSLRFLKEKGKLVLIATTAQIKNVDLTPLWFREINLVGSSMYSHVTWQDNIWRTYELAMELIKTKLISTDKLLTHKFHIKQFQQAINVNLKKKKHKSTKVVFNFK